MHHHHHRRRKKRPNYATRSVEIQRGLNGLGFILSGQQPCILSCIVSNSPADHAGLRAGDFLISVNGLNVSKLPHESVVELIGKSYGTIRMHIAENYFSDSSDEENLVNSQINRVRPRYLHHKLKMNRLRNSPQKIRNNASSNLLLNNTMVDDNGNSCLSGNLRPVIEDILPLPEFSAAHNIIHSPNASTSRDISNVSAMVRKENDSVELVAALSPNLFDHATGNEINALEYQAVVGYLGTIEMPKQIATSSKLQTVRSCIRKLRQEKRNPTTVLMTILPRCLTLKNTNATILATYPSSRLNYVSSSSESENRFFGLVTSAIYTNMNDDEPLNHEEAVGGLLTREVIISNSCHVFVVDTKICDHYAHEQRAQEFHITCTKDPISNLCLEFPNNSEYVVNLIRSMYTMKVLPPSMRNIRNLNNDNAQQRNHPDPQANSPQPSNHSEITTTSSNSDSGIGFHNDCTNISDRILVVDFPGLMMNNRNDNANACPARPLGICNSINASTSNSPANKTLNNSTDCRLTVRAMPDPKVNSRIPDILATFNAIKDLSPQSPSKLISTRSCDDVISSVERNDFININNSKKQLQMSMDDVTILSNTANENYVNSDCSYEKHDNKSVFIAPGKPIRKNKKLPCISHTICNNNDKSEPKNGTHLKNSIPNKLSPKVFGIHSKKQTITSNSFDNFSESKHHDHIDVTNASANKNSINDFENWGSLQELNRISDEMRIGNGNFLEGTFSEPDLKSRALPSNVSPFRRWGQSSFRASRNTEQQKSTEKRPSSLVASENDVYTKSMDEFIEDASRNNNQSSTLDHIKSNDTKYVQIVETNTDDNSGGVQCWGNSFEKLLEDQAGLHTFAEFLKKEFSAENIYFWTACERYRLIEDNTERATKAMEIFTKHLANGAIEPVNIDSQARNTAEDNLQLADKNLFNQAQKQIFNLMKFDSYQRFIRSDLYKKCLEAESKNQTLPYPAELLDENLKTRIPTSPGPSKLKKSVSNAEDRRRKSLLPWHRKIRCKSRDRANNDSESTQSLNKSQSSTNNSLKNNNSNSDLHSSRSSLSSFDTNAGFNAPDDQSKATTLCRVILSDGATTIVPTRSDETIRQLIERLLEKRGINYQFFDVMLNGQTKAIDLENSASILAGKEVQIEQRVAFKLDLPDPKVISVKSKPKKQLCDVLKPILQKYNYCFNNVYIMLRDTHEQLDLTLPVTIADGQRLQVVLLKNNTDDVWQHQKSRNGICPMGYQQLPKIISSLQPNTITAKTTTKLVPQINSNCTQQSTLDEITNKVFNELLNGGQIKKSEDLCSIKSDDATSETSSIFSRLRRSIDPTNPGIKNLRPKKSSNNYDNFQQNKLTTTQSDDTLNTITQNLTEENGIKKPLMVKWKTGVKLQVTGRPQNQNQDEFLEGLKRAQRARLEDQRGTEINFELPDFLKDKANLSAANKLRKIRANLSPINQNGSNSKFSLSDEFVQNKRNSLDSTQTIPQPAPRLSITKSISSTAIPSTSSGINSTLNNSPIQQTITESNNSYSPNRNSKGLEYFLDSTSVKGPPPLPPKPKILPMKPSNWGATPNSTISLNANRITPNDANRSSTIKSGNTGTTETNNAYLDQPSSSFV